MCKIGEKQLNKINMFFKKYKTKVIVYSSIFIVVLIISNILLNIVCKENTLWVESIME